MLWTTGIRVLDGFLIPARISLFAADDGGPESAFPNGSRSMQLLVPGPNSDQPDVQIGAAIYSDDDSPLAPGRSQFSVELRCWAVVASRYLVPGTAFDLWNGRVVGCGVVIGPGRNFNY